MPWIQQISIDEATGQLKREFDKAIRRAGRVWHIVHIMSVNPRVLKIFVALPKKTEDFSFVKPLHGFERITEGQLIGRDGTIEMRAPADAYAVLPNDAVPLRKNVVYLAREE